MTNKKRIGLAVPIGLYQMLKDEATYTGHTLSSLILQVLWDWHDEQKNAPPGASTPDEAARPN